MKDILTILFEELEVLRRMASGVGGRAEASLLGQIGAMEEMVLDAQDAGVSVDVAA